MHYLCISIEFDYREFPAFSTLRRRFVRRIKAPIWTEQPWERPLSVPLAIVPCTLSLRQCLLQTPHPLCFHCHLRGILV